MSLSLVSGLRGNLPRLLFLLASALCVATNLHGNDPPVPTGSSILFLEDLGHVFDAADFPFTDAESDELVKLRFLAPALGTLWVDNDSSGFLDNGELAIKDNDEVQAADITKLKYLNALDENGADYTTISYDVFDGTGYSTSPGLVNVSVAAVNDPPVSSDKTVTALEDTVFTFAESDFPFSDPDSHLAKVRLQAVSTGVLWVDGDGSGALDNGESIVTNGAEVLVASIPKLKFLADQNANGAANATFLFETNDGAAFSHQATMTIDVSAVNDAPVASDNTVTADEDVPYIFLANIFTYTDVESDPLVKLRLHAVSSGSLWVDMNSNGEKDPTEPMLADLDEVGSADIPKLTFLADPDVNGPGYATFLFEVFDGTDYSNQASLYIDVSPVNDVPVPSGSAIGATEETVYAFTSADFPFFDAESDAMNKVRLQAVTQGTLWLDLDANGILDNGEVAVADDDELLPAAIANLRYLAPDDAFGTAYATFLYHVHDGTAYSDLPGTVTINVANVSDIPLTADNAATAKEDTVFAFSASDFPFTDVDGDPLAKVRLQAVTAGNLWVDLNDDGMFENVEVPVADNDEVLAADIHLLKFLPVLDAYGPAYATFKFEVYDGTVYSSPATFTLNVDAVNDEPLSADNLVKVTADEPFAFSIADFPFTDLETPTLDRVRLQAASAGTLWVDTNGDGTLDLSETEVVADTEVGGTLLHLLKFLPDPGAQGGVYATFRFEVHDGTDYSLANYTMTVEVATILLDNSVLPENQLAGTAVGTLRIAGSAGGDSFALIAGAGDTDNAKFAIVGDVLQLAEDFGPPINATYSIRVEGTRQDATYSESTLSIQVRPHPPVSLNLSSTSIQEAPVPGKTVGTITVSDPDLGDSHTFALIDPSTYPDNLFFTFVGDTLLTAFPLDFEAQASRTIQIQATDSFGETFSQVLTIQVENAAEPVLGDSEIPEFQPIGTEVGILLPEALDIPAQNVGQALWDYTTGGDVLSSPAIGPDGKLYVGSSDYKVYAFDSQDGNLVWSFTSGGIVQSTPAVSLGGMVYFGSDDFNVYALDSADGSKLWEFATGGKVRSSVAIGPYGEVYVGSDDFNVYALDGATGTKLWEFTTGNRVSSSPAVGADGKVYIGSYDAKVYALDGQTGAKAWEFISGGLILSSPAIDADGVIYIGSNDFKAYALDGQTGSKLWEYATGGEVKSSPAIGPDGTVYLGSFDDKLYALEGKDGSLKWTYTTAGDVYSSPAIGADGSVYVGSHDGKLHVVDALTGLQQWEVATGGSVWASPAIGVFGGVFFAAWDDKVYAVQGSSRPDGSQWPMFGRSQMRNHALHTGLVQYSLVPGDGDTDNALFSIEGDRLLQAGDLSATGKKVFYVRVKGVDELGNVFEGSLMVDLFEALELDNVSILENQPADSKVGSFSMPLAQPPVTYTLVAGEGDSGNPAFQFDGDVLQAVMTMDFEVQAQYSVRVRGEGSAGLVVEKVFTIDIGDLNDLPVAQDITLLASEDIPYAFSSAVFPMQDQDGDSLSKIRLQAASKGTFWLDLDGNGTLGGSESAIADGDEVQASDIDSLRFLANANESGSGYATFGVEAHDGTAYSAPVLYTMDLLAVNDLPVPSGKTVSTQEDTVLVLGTGDFLFSDIEGNAATKFRIQIPSNGILWVDLNLNGILDNGESALTNGLEVPANSIPGLRYLPNFNGNGTDYDSFQFDVHDGTNYSTSPATITIDVSPVQDPPTSANQTVSTQEDNALVFVLGDFLFFDNESDPFSQLKIINTPPGVLWLDLDGSGAMDNGEAAIISNAVIQASLRSKLMYLPPANANGFPYTQFSFEVSDGISFSAPSLMTVNVTPMPDPPESGDNAIVMLEDRPYTFQTSDFLYSDPDGDALASIWVFSLDAGTMWLDTDDDGVVDSSETIVGTFDEILAAHLPSLKFLPAPNANGSSYATFGFQVSDGSSLSTPASNMTVHVNPVNDIPTSDDASRAAPYGQALVFNPSDFPFYDVDGDTLSAVRFQPVSVGTLWLDADASGSMDNGEAPVAAFQTITTADIPYLSYLAGAGAGSSQPATFSFEVFDGQIFSSSHFMSIDLSGLNFAPVSQDFSVLAFEDTPFAFKTTDFPFDDADSNTISRITLGEVSAGILWVDSDRSGSMDNGESPLGPSDTVLAVDIPKLTYLAPANANGTSLATFPFAVYDGFAASAQHNATINVQSVNDAPVSTNGSFEATEGEAHSIDFGIIAYSDLEGSPLASFHVQDLTAGTLWLDQDADGSIGAAEPKLDSLQAGSLEIDAADFPKVSFLPAPGESGVPYASFRFRVSDGSDYSLALYTMTINVPDTNGPPVLVPIGELSTPEDTSLEIFPVANDPDGDNVTFLAKVNSGNISAKTDGGRITFFPLQDWNGVANITIIAHDPKGAEDSETFNLTVTSMDDAPRAINPAIVRSLENQPVGTIVAIFTTVDPDLSDSHSYTLAPALANPDNAYFTMDANLLLTAAILDFESKPSYNVVVQTTDSANLSLTQSVNVTLLDQPEPPSAILVDFMDILQSMEPGSPIAVFSAEAADGQDTITFSLVPDGGGSDLDNAFFFFDGDTLLSAKTLDFSQYAALSVNVQAKGQLGISLTQSFVIQPKGMPGVFPPIVATGSHLVLEGQYSVQGSILHNGNATIIEKGVLYGLSSGLHYGAQGVTSARSQDTAPDVIESVLPNLSQGREYYYRAYAMNIQGVAYGQERSFLVPRQEAVSQLWLGATPLGSNWFDQPGFGLVYVLSEWVFHSGLGWIYVVEDGDAGGLWFWTMDLGWSWTTLELFPYVWNHNGQSWLFWFETTATHHVFYNATESHTQLFPLD